MSMINNPPHIEDKEGQILPSALIPFCAFGSVLQGKVLTNISFPVCNLFDPVVYDGKLCYQVDLSKKIPKETYKKMVKKMVNKAAFKSYTAKKETHQKIRNLEYEQLELKPYLKSNEFSGKERQLLTLLRSRCHPARNNFKKMYIKVNEDIEFST